MGTWKAYEPHHLLQLIDVDDDESVVLAKLRNMSGHYSYFLLLSNLSVQNKEEEHNPAKGILVFSPHRHCRQFVHEDLNQSEFIFVEGKVTTSHTRWFCMKF